MQCPLIKLSLFVALSVIGAEASAMTINLATGQNGSGVIQTGADALDANWTQQGAAVPKSGSQSFVVDPSSPDWYGPWLPNGPMSAWIAPNPDSTNGNGNFTLTYHFNLAGLDLSTANFSGLRWAIDDSGTLALNGHTLSSLAPGQWTALTDVNAPVADLVQGINTLTIVSTGADYVWEGARLEGFLTANPTQNIPEPADLALVGLGGVALVFSRRRGKLA